MSPSKQPDIQQWNRPTDRPSVCPSLRASTQTKVHPSIHASIQAGSQHWELGFLEWQQGQAVRASGSKGVQGMGGSVVEFSPATREARVRFPAHAESSPFWSSRAPSLRPPWAAHGQSITGHSSVSTLQCCQTPLLFSYLCLQCATARLCKPSNLHTHPCTSTLTLPSHTLLPLCSVDALRI